MFDKETELDKIFLSYNKILKRLNIQNIKKKNGEEITMMDVMVAASTMVKKHPSCRWRSTKVRNRKFLVLFEGYLWIRNVYFKYDKRQIDLDIEFFEKRIKQYEEFLKLDSRPLWNEDINANDICRYFHRQEKTIKNAMKKMQQFYGDSNLFYYKDGEFYIQAMYIEWLCKNCFKQKYLELLENYKMELTEKYIEAGYIYDEFFGRN